MRIFRPVSYRNSRISRSGDCRGNARHNFKLDSGFRDRLRLFRTSTKNKRVASLQSNNLFSLTRFLHEKRVNLWLAQGVFARLFARVNSLCVVSRPSEHLRICQMIINDDISRFDALLRAQCGKSKIARPRADEVNLSILTRSRAHARNRVRPLLPSDPPH